MRRFTIVYFAPIAIAFFCATATFAQKPVIFFSDLTSGPAKGGEKGNGALVTLYGNNFGTNPSIVVGNKPAIVKTAPSAYLWYQRLTIQIPSTTAQGATTISISNESGASNSLPFTVRNGRIVVVTSAAQLKSIRSSWKAGDIYYPQGTWSLTGDDGNGWHASFSIFGPSGQNYPEGTAEAPIAIIGYPGSNVTIGGGAEYGIRGDRSFITFANVSIRGDKAAANPTWSRGLRYIANDISAPTTHGQMGCWSSNSVIDVKFLGNNVHNCGTNASDKQDHAVYFSTDVNHVEMAWNADHDNQACYGVQFHSSPINEGSGKNQFDLHVHDNQFYNQVCAAVNFATVDPSKGTVEMYNNLVYNSGMRAASDGGVVACLYLAGITNTGSAGNGAVQVYNNTFYNCGATFLSDNDSFHPVNLKNNVVQITNGNYLTINQGGVSGSSNVWFGAGGGPRQTSGNINADPKFVNPASGDFRLQPGSPAIDTGQAIESKLGMNLVSSSADLAGMPRTTGSSIDVGCFEFSDSKAHSSTNH